MALAPPGGHVPHRRSQGLRASGADGVWDARLGDFGVRLRGLRGCAVWELRSCAVWGYAATRFGGGAGCGAAGLRYSGFRSGIGIAHWGIARRPLRMGGGYPIAWGLAAPLPRRPSRIRWRLPDRVGFSSLFGTATQPNLVAVTRNSGSSRRQVWVTQPPNGGNRHPFG